MTEYIFSICIPVYNTEKYLPRALDSIVNQDFDTSKVEVVIVNDASPHTTECTKIIYDYSNLLSIKYIKKEKNEGLLLARKTGVEAANGKYILFLDADDTFQLDAFHILFQAVSDAPDYVQFQIYSVECGCKTLFSLMLKDEKNKTIEDVLQNKVIHSLVNKCYSSKMLKEIYKDIPHFYAVYAEDYYQSALVEYYALKKFFIDIPLYNYFRNIGITTNNTFQDREKVLKILESFNNIQGNLVSFFKEKDEEIYAEYVKNYMSELHFNLVLWTNSLSIVFFILKVLPAEYQRFKAKMLICFFKYRVKNCIKNILPYGLVVKIQNAKHKGL